MRSTAGCWSQHRDRRHADLPAYRRAYRGHLPSPRPVNTNLALALAYARTGILVFPCDTRKRPLTARGHHDATTGLDTIRRWWARWPDALVGVPTGPGSGVWILDIDGEVGRRSLNALMTRLGVAAIADLTPCISRTPGGGLHLIFTVQPGELPRNRARDIGAGLDTRGVKADGASAGYFIAPGSTLPDGRRYQPMDAHTLEPVEPAVRPFENAAPAPRKLLGLATFNDTERAVIAASPDLRDAIRSGEPASWPATFEEYRAAQRATVLAHPARRRDGPAKPEHARQHQYAAAILSRELLALAAMRPGSGRNHAAFKLSCRVGRWIHHGVISRDAFERDVLDACERNGLVAEDGRKAVADTISSGLGRSANDALPELEARA